MISVVWGKKQLDAKAVETFQIAGASNKARG